MSAFDVWGDVVCPNCSKESLHVFYFDSDCRGNDSSRGAYCRNCEYKAPEDKIGDLLMILEKKLNEKQIKELMTELQDRIVLEDKIKQEQ